MILDLYSISLIIPQRRISFTMSEEVVGEGFRVIGEEVKKAYEGR